MSDYPEHDKMRDAIDNGASEKVQEFIDWLYDHKQWTVAEFQEHEHRRFGEVLVPVSLTREQIMADFYSIDLRKVDDEKRIMLTTIRTENARAES
jgi:hypothetical protein